MIVLKWLFSIFTIIALFLSACAFAPNHKFTNIKFRNVMNNIAFWYLSIIYPLVMSGISMGLWFATMPEI